jgi:CDP-diacylglycerol---serine O-phosphatidyltransferase
MKPIRAVAVLPTLFTLGNLVCGFFAIVVVSRIANADILDFVASPQLESMRQLIRSTDPTHNLLLAGGLIFLAMLFDTFDGQVARLTRVTSDFGAQLDSLCDAVSFGVAPAILLVKMCPQFTSVHKEAVWSIAALFAGCAVLRLARYNVELDDEVDDHTTFVGLPAPAAAAVVASFAVLSYTLRNEINFERYEQFDYWLQRLLPPFTLLLALLMVSRFPYPHIVTQVLRGQRSFAHVVAVVFSIMALLIVRAYALPIVCVIFVLGPPSRYLWNLARHRQTQQEPLF